MAVPPLNRHVDPLPCPQAPGGEGATSSPERHLTSLAAGHPTGKGQLRCPPPCRGMLQAAVQRRGSSTPPSPSPGVNMMLRKIAVAAASKPAVEIKQDGETFYIKTSTTVRTTEISFRIGEEFEEQTVDGRPCKSLARWESENKNKMVCEQRLLKGEGPKTGWSREMTNDGELILTMTADDVVCTRVYVRE
ncbi:PREDICTED: cellular retinoic acid-binding protein 2 [Haliaeetus leucocephalus]|uniref:cellular retinoic acid-binding protein 2 n=1 Tax=Haliaeetus leucocephalus TaxID=52644 RepID=UPI00053CAD98|nr:PREDICTED: cellular retinoic acid-binding protein 2 [Haliaeetus leucocephalus]